MECGGEGTDPSVLTMAAADEVWKRGGESWGRHVCSRVAVGMGGVAREGVDQWH